VIYQDVLDTEVDLSQGIPASRRLAVSDLRLPFTYFASQLHTLLGVPTLPVRFLPLAATTQSVTRPLDGWQKVNLMRSLAESNMVEAQNSLTSIARLVGKIKEMVINEDVRRDVAGAVNALQQVSQSSRQIMVLNSY
jgi:phosphatidylinositol glycan class S